MNMSKFSRVKCDGFDVEINLTDEELKWTYVNVAKDETYRSVKFENIVAVSDDEAPHCLIVHWAEAKPTNILSAENAIFIYEIDDQCRLLAKNIKDKIANLAHDRPKRLLVIINPYAGKRSAEQLYNETAAPLFQLANVQVDVIVTERQHHAVEIMQEYDLRSVHGVVSVGGDGTFKECYTGLILRALKEEGCDRLNKQSMLQRLKMRLGPLPGGSRNMLQYLLNKTKDFATITLNIILGRRGCPLDVGALYCGDQFLGFSTFGVGLGMNGDYVNDADKYRIVWFLGETRYLLALFKNLLFRRAIDVVIEYKTHDSAICHEDVGRGQVCGNPSAHAQSQTIRESFLDVRILNVKDHGKGTGVHLSPGRWHLYLIKPCSMWQHWDYYRRVFQTSGDVELDTMGHVKYVEADELTITIKDGGRLRGEGGRHVIHIDGEVICLPEPNVTAKLHKGIISCFGMEQEE